MPCKTTFAAQASALQTVTQTTFKEMVKEAETKAKAKDQTYVVGTYELPFQIKRVPDKPIVTDITIPEGFELEVSPELATYLKIQQVISNAYVSEFIWVGCDLVDQTAIGEGMGLRLLTPTPIKLNTNTNIMRMEYVPMETKKFSTLDIKLYTNLKTLGLYQTPYAVQIVLHFKPNHKRKGTASVESFPQKKHGCGCGILQQAPAWGLSQTWPTGGE